jgi:hypothetical protein
MTTTTYTFRVITAQSPYTCVCEDCGKLLKRVAKVEHTVNPFNTNEDGSQKSPAEVRQSAQRHADEEAALKQDTLSICRDCEDVPVRDLLLEMAESPDKIFSRDLNTWGSPMHTLLDRKQVTWTADTCSCGAPCCSGHTELGLQITRKGLVRAESHKKKMASHD